LGQRGALTLANEDLLWLPRSAVASAISLMDAFIHAVMVDKLPCGLAADSIPISLCEMVAELIPIKNGPSVKATLPVISAPNLPTVLVAKIQAEKLSYLCLPPGKHNKGFPNRHGEREAIYSVPLFQDAGLICIVPKPPRPHPRMEPIPLAPVALISTSQRTRRGLPVCQIASYRRRQHAEVHWWHRRSDFSDWPDRGRPAAEADFLTRFTASVLPNKKINRTPIILTPHPLPYNGPVSQRIHQKAFWRCGAGAEGEGWTQNLILRVRNWISLRRHGGNGGFLDKTLPFHLRTRAPGVPVRHTRDRRAFGVFIAPVCPDLFREGRWQRNPRPLSCRESRLRGKNR
jgi:hypothetical protein